MRIISLNTWGGRAMQPLMHFVRSWRDKVDIFCFQEVHDTTQEYREKHHPDEWVRWDLWAKLQERLPDFDGFFAQFETKPDRMSVATFIRRGIPYGGVSSVEIFRPDVPIEKGSSVISARKLQTVLLPVDGRQVLLINYHGLWVPGGKGDSPERLRQSRAIRDIMAMYRLPTVLMGDLNLEPDTKSLAILKEDMWDLVKEYQITSTRTPLYREYHDPTVGKYADYALVSYDIRINEFRVLPDIASDHAALYLDFGVNA